MRQLFRMIRNELASDLSSPGSFYIYALVVVAFFVSGDYNFSLQLFIAAFSVSIATYAIKLFYYKPRPDNKKRVKYKDIFIRLNESSFPSIHAARAAILGIAFMSRYENVAATVFAVFIIASVSISRIKLKRHYLSDVVAGIFLGLLAGYLVFF